MKPFFFFCLPHEDAVKESRTAGFFFSIVFPAFFFLWVTRSSSALPKQQVSRGWRRCVWKAENFLLWIYFDPGESKGNPLQSEKDGKRQIIILSEDEIFARWTLRWFGDVVKKRGSHNLLPVNNFQYMLTLYKNTIKG